MVTKLGLSFILTTIILQICEKITCESSGNLQQGFTTRCDELCSNDIQEDLRTDCQRGCQYFNIEFLISANDKNKVTDLETTHQKCHLSCLEAYSSLSIQATKKDACDTGCRKMNDLQAKAPYLNGWLTVYMGTSDHSMVLLQPDLDISSDDDWVLLDSVLKSNSNDYDKMFDQYKVTETHIQTIQYQECNRRFSLDFSWLWIFPMLGIMFATIQLVQKYDINNMDESLTEKIFTNSGCKSFDQNENFVVSNDTYFYPSPAIPPPKYNEAIEAMLLSDEEETNVENELKCSSDQK